MAVYGTPWNPVGSAAGPVIDKSVALLTTRLYVLLAVFPVLSVTVTATEYGLALFEVGVPLMMPVVTPMLNPGGSPVAAQV